MRAVLLAAALLLAPATATQALPGAPSSSFTVQNAALTPSSPVLVDGVNWRCNTDNVCIGSGGQSQPASRACRRVVARVGVALASFTYRGTTLTSDELAACNIAAAA